MSADNRSIWDELGWLVAIYMALVVGYSIFLNQVYNQALLSNLPEMLKDIPDFVARDKGIDTKIQIIIVLSYVVLYTIPLVTSAFTIAYSSDQALYKILLKIIIPFSTYFLVFDRGVLIGKSGLLATTHNAGEMIIYILSYYFSHYKFPLAVFSVILGFYGGYKMKSAERN